MLKQKLSAMRRPGIEALIAVLALSLGLLPACGPHVGRQTVRIKYYQACYQPLLELRASQEKVKSDTAKGAAAGAVAGAVAGLLARGDLKGALVGAMVGAAVGAVGTYLVSSSLQEKALSERLDAYNGAMDSARADLDIASKAAKTTCDCYRREYDTLTKNYRRKKSVTPADRAEMLERLQEMRDGNNDAIEILTYYQNVSADNLKTFDEVVRHEETRTADKAPAKTVNTIKKKRNEYKKSSDTVQSGLTTARRNASLFTDEYNLIEQAQMEHMRRLAGRPAPESRL
jgi:hypothetical protein